MTATIPDVDLSAPDPTDDPGNSRPDAGERLGPTDPEAFSFENVQATETEPIKPDPKKSRAARTDARRTKREKKTMPRYKSGMYVEDLTTIYQTTGLMLFPLDQVCSTALVTNADKCAVALDDLAGKNVAVQRAVEMLTQTSSWGAVIVAHTPILLAVLSHHTNLPVPEVTFEPPQDSENSKGE